MTAISTPFQNLALSLSGGGFRAAAFHLGSMSYLNHAQWKQTSLIQRLVVLSTISGGTITGVKYALCLAEGKSFKVFFKELYDFLKADQLLTKALENLNDPKAWDRPLKQRNLINAFTLVYHKDLLDEKTFGALLDINDPRFPEVAFNSTDIENQLGFRFQKSEKGLIGHGKIDVPENAAREIRLADIVAASSCFPGGFEPLLMSSDFVAPDNSLLAAFWKGKPQVRLMDGGIVDNQGIESVLLFEKRKSRDGAQPHIGTFLISDVSKKEVKYPEQKPEGNPWLLNLSLRQHVRLALVLLLAAAAGLWFSESKWLTIIASILLTLSGLWAFVGFWVVKKFVDSIKETVSQEAPSFMENLDILRRVKLKFVVNQLKARVTSLGRLGDVFLKRIRDMNYRFIFSDKNWNYRIRTNYLYHLKNDPAVSAKLKPYVDSANEMGTTLWFSDRESNPENHALDALVITGQATMCQNLILYVEYLKKEMLAQLPAELQLEINQLEASCRKDFERFNEEPAWLLKP